MSVAEMNSISMFDAYENISFGKHSLLFLMNMRHITTWMYRKSGRANYLSSNLDMLFYTPPQVDKLGYRHRRVKALRKRPHINLSLFPSGIVRVSPAQKVISSFPIPFSLRLLNTGACPDFYVAISLKFNGIQIDVPPIVWQGCSAAQWISSHHIVLERQGGFLSEKDQKQKENQPAPEKPKTKKSKTRREGDKGSKEGKEPNTDGLVTFSS